MELNKTAEQWQKCDPKAMAKMSEAAIMYALADARSDILRMHAEIERLKADLDAEKLYSKQAGEAVEQIAAERDELSAKLAVLEKQEPLGDGYTMLVTTGNTPSTMETKRITILGIPVYAAAGAAQAYHEPVRDMPHGWIVNWPSPNGGTKPVYHASSIKPKFGTELDGKLTMYPVYTKPQKPVEQRCQHCDDTGDVHGKDGEWRGVCTCSAGAAPDYAKAIHYPECWDTMAYPSADAALREMVAWFKCSNEGCSQAVPIQSSSFPEHNPNLPNNEQGIFRKFLVSRVDGSDKPGGKHHGCEYFVLDMMHDKHAPAALRAYAESCKTTHPKLSTDLAARFGSAPTEPLSQFDIRGQLAARLSCWHRLTESESKELVKLFEVGEKHVATMGCTECKFVNIAPDDAPCCNCNHLEYGIDNFVRKEPTL